MAVLPSKNIFSLNVIVAPSIPSPLCVAVPLTITGINSIEISFVVMVSG